MMSPINKHVHLLESELKQYVFAEHELSQIQIEHIELELQICEVCSNKYVALLESSVIPAEPMLTDEKYDQLLTRIEQQQSKMHDTPVRKHWFEQSIVHVVAAASITGILFISGFLSIVTNAMLEEEPSKSPSIKVEEKENWFTISEPKWVKELQEQFKELNQFKLFKEDQ